MKILQNETSNNTTTTSTTTSVNSKEKLHHLQHSIQSSSQQQQQIVEKRKAKTLKNKILQNVAQQQQQEEHNHQQQQQQEFDQNAIVNNNHNTPSAMTDEHTKSNYNSNNNTKVNNSITADIKTSKPSSSIASKLLKDSLSSCSNQNKNGCSSTNSDLILAEAAKILLKNGLNGTNAAAAAAVATATATLLTAAANFHQLPPASNSNEPLNCNSTTSLSSPTTTSVSETSTLAGNVTTAAATAHAQLVAIAAAAAAVNATNQKRLAAPTSTLLTSPTSSSSTCRSPSQTFNNGLLANIETQPTSGTLSTPTSIGTTTITQFTKPYKANSCKSTMSSSMDMDIFDYTVNLNSNATAPASSSPLSPSSSSSIINLSASANSNINSNIEHQKFLNNNIHSLSNRPDIGRPPIPHHSTSNISNHKNVASGGYGGRLQFFKDGKFILELARSKDGEKGGWVSVPRKIFRTPSAATSSTVTPSATASAAIPTSLSASPAAAVGGSSYPKNECSNSLSFSDDNSSIQSSPWQRDHCWKQLAPRKNVSTEMEIYYRKPVYHKFTTQAISLSHKKHRKPHDTKTLEYSLIFCLNNKEQLKHNKDNRNRQGVDESTHSKKEVGLKEEINKNATIIKKEVDERDDIKHLQPNSEFSKTQNDNGENANTKNDGKNAKSSDSKISIKTEAEGMEKEDDAKQKLSCKTNFIKDAKVENDQEKETVKKDHTEKIYTSDLSNDKGAHNTQDSTASNGDVVTEGGTSSAEKGHFLKTGDEEKRLKKQANFKTRAKLTTIVQKLIDVSTSRLAGTAQRFKASNQVTSATAASSPSASTSTTSSTSANLGSSSGGAKNQNSKVSPPSNAAASRLVEYHQQHVSPRKRILREFEKVSLEDNASGASGGKRSRAKVNNTSTVSTNINASSLLSNTNATNKSNISNAHNSNAGNTLKSVASAAPTKLYSSYSIHSLLGGGLSTSTIPTSSAKKSTDLPATITSSSMSFSPYHSSAPFPSNSISNNSPKSPEGGGKSPSNSLTKSKRSPPYSSPMRETHSRSPIICGSGGYADYSGRRSPRSTPDTAHNSFNKMRCNSSGGPDTSASPTNHHLHQHHLQQHYQPHPQTYYSPYMMSPHYVPPLSGASALSPNAAVSSNAVASSATVSSRSPRHHPSAFRATTPTLAASTTHNIPNSQKGDLSPQRSTTSSPREITPRTLPKKTASIRRQFASPTSAATQNHNTSNCSSPITNIDEQLTNDRRTPVNSSTPHQQHQQTQHLMQRGSPGNSSLAGSPIHPYSYLYAQPPNGNNSSHNSLAGGSNHPSSAMSPSSVNASAAAAAASYIPAVVGTPYYHPYISTLAAMRHPQMWMQHYQSAAAAAANPALMQARHPAMLSAAARLSPPYHGFQYNGVGNAAALAAAAAAAAAGFGSTATPTHSSNTLSNANSIFNPMVNSSLQGMQHPATAMQAAGLVPASAAAAALSVSSPMTDTTDLSKSSKNNFSFSTSSSTSTLGDGGSLPTSTGSPGNSMYTISNKDEQSSDVPLNLSKH